jgi:hypothetical protein
MLCSGLKLPTADVICEHRPVDTLQHASCCAQLLHGAQVQSSTHPSHPPSPPLPLTLSLHTLTFPSLSPRPPSGPIIVPSNVRLPRPTRYFRLRSCV